jgi:hypothetical protein
VVVVGYVWGCWFGLGCGFGLVCVGVCVIAHSVMYSSVMRPVVISVIAVGW